ncbi:conserved oligomeric Golgi complex subunit 1-like [Bolinopsis microptera]|uniref:conserved oligomeric Golgi complex subunit 1-like n=1 Tax=Bolinopsis microptera TaxID=2820187 RepID=UPI00307A0979
MTPASASGTRKHLVSQSSVLSQPDLLSPEDLFSQYTINEIQRNFKKIQRDIESKKSELRTMVGERYRELINTADTIAEMENTVKDIRTTLDSIQTSCKLERISSIEKEEEHSKKEEFWSIASQMKLLVDTPEKIWHAMENKQFLIAGQLYLLSRHIVTNLHIGNGAASQHLTQFPVLAQQWGAISHFKPSILQGCKDTLGGVSVSDEQFTESICTVILLEGVDLETLIVEVMERRLAGVAARLTSGGSVRNQIADCVESIICTLDLVHNNLVTSNRVTDKLKHLCHNVTTMEVVSNAFKQETGLQSITRHLPTLVHSYHPTINSSLELPNMTQLCEGWWQKVVAAVNDNLHTTLHYVQSVSSVAGLVKPYCQKSSSEWETVCLGVLNKKIHIWNDLLQAPMNEHVKKIISSYIEDAMMATTTDISEIIKTHSEANVSIFVWNINCKKETKLQQKAEGFVDSVRSLCSNLNDRLTIIYNDIITYTGNPEKFRYKEDNVRAEEIFAHVYGMTKQSLVQVSQHILTAVPDEADISENSRSDQLAILIHVCRCLVQHTSQLQQLLNPRDRSKYSASSSEMYQCIVSAKCVLLQRYGGWVSDVVTEKLSTFLKSEAATFAMVWEETQIKEETEDGGSVESKISLPVYTSSYVNTILFALSSELYRIGCHGFTEGEVPLMLGSLDDKIVQVYDAWLETAEITQNMALQYWLDFKYLTAMCNVASSVNSERNKKITTVVRRIETNIDPFDWDVFQPHLTGNLHGLIRRTYNLYGAVSIYSTTIQAIATSAARAAFQQNTHNVLLRNEMVSRFSLLPVRSDPDSDHLSEDESPDLEHLSSLCRTIDQYSSPVFGL